MDIKHLFFRAKLLLLSLVSFSMFAQNDHGFGGDAGLLINDYDEISSYLSFKYNHALHPYVALSVGLNFQHAKINKMFDSPFESNVVYDIDDNIVNMNAIAGLKLASPTWKDFGLGVDLDFQFEPIPYSPISVDKLTYDPSSDYYTKQDVGKNVYSRFNPSYHLQFSLIYHIKQQNSRLKLAIGYGISNYNVYNGYYRAKVEGAELNRHLKLKPSKIGSSIFVRVAI